MWTIKFIICVLYDLFDFTLGRLLFATPFAGEVVGAVLGCAMFGTRGLYYAFEALDPTEQLDGFIPTATLIALADRRARREAEEQARASRALVVN